MFEQAQCLSIARDRSREVLVGVSLARAARIGCPRGLRRDGTRDRAAGGV